MKKNVLLIQPFRKPSLKEIIVKDYPCWEIINTSPLTLGAVMELLKRTKDAEVSKI